jgi:hypothetical protein
MPIIIPGNSQASTGYTISQSIRFNDDDNPYLVRTLGTASDGGKTYTFSWWQKLGSKFGAQAMYMIHTDLAGGNSADYLYFYNDNFYSWHGTNSFITDREFRDPSAWYHFVYVYDSTQAIASERLRLYVNGIRETSFSTENYPSLNATSYFNTNRAHYIGGANASGNRLDSYMAEIHFLDGLGYDPSFFGEFNDSGIWIPKEYTGSYGSNGFKIDGRDSSDLGDDESGNGNDFTSYNLTASDQVLDSPTNNFATLNPIYADVSGINSITVANGNLQGTGTSGQFDHKTATFNLPKSGKWYFEYYLGGLYTGFGICIVGQEASIAGGYGFGALSTSQGFGYQNDSIYNGNAVTTALGLGNRSAGDILNVAVDVDNDKFYLGINNTYVAADGGADGNPSSGTNPTVTTSFSLSTNDIILGFYLSSSSSSVYLNFGQEGTFGGNKTAGGNSDASGIGNFLYSVPTGFKALCTKNLGS